MKDKMIHWGLKLWFPIFLVCTALSVFMVTDNSIGKIEIPKCEVESDRPNCYIFYGTAQKVISMEKEFDYLGVNYLIEGWPGVEHDIFIEIVDHHGKVDFLYSEKHTANHKAHYHSDKGQRPYKAYYRIKPSKHGPGKWKLRVTFRFHLPLGTTSYVSNDIPFIIK